MKRSEKAKASRKRQKLKNYRQTQDAENKGSPYTEKEIDMILAHEVSDRELSRIIGRSVQAIQIKRTRLKKEEK